MEKVMQAEKREKLSNGAETKERKCTALPLLLCSWWTLQHIKHVSSLTHMLLLKKLYENIGCHLEGHWSVKPKWKLEPCPLKKTMQYNAIYHVHTDNSFQENQKKAETFPKSVTTNIYTNGSVFFLFLWTCSKDDLER